MNSTYTWECCEDDRHWILHLRCLSNDAVQRLCVRTVVDVTNHTPFGIMTGKMEEFNPTVDGVDRLGINSRYSIGFLFGAAFSEEEVKKNILHKLEIMECPVDLSGLCDPEAG